MVAREDGALAAWIAAVGWTWVGAGGEVAADGVVVEVMSGAARGWIAVPAGMARAIADLALGRRAELAAPRPISAVERALAALVIADAVARIDPAAAVAIVEAVPGGRHPTARARVSAPVAGEVLAFGGFAAVAAPIDLARAGLLPPVPVAVEAARGQVALARLGGLARGDVVIVGPPSARLAVARGSIAASLDHAGGVATVAGPYTREPPMSADPAQLLAADLPVALTVVVGEVELPAAAVLALAPGQTVALGRPVGGPVELRAGGRVVGRGELVVVDGDLGVRLLDVLSSPAPAC